MPAPLRYRIKYTVSIPVTLKRVLHEGALHFLLSTPPTILHCSQLLVLSTVTYLSSGVVN